MSKLAPEHLNELINDVIAVWAVEELKFYKERAAKVPSATGKGKEDISVGVVKATADNVGTVSFAFYNYMRYREMRRLNNKYFPLEEAKKWIEAKGFNNFAAKYEKITGRKKPSDNVRLLNEIAWGIIRGARKHKPKRWYNREKWKGINVLWNQVTDEIAEAILQGVKNEILKK